MTHHPFLNPLEKALKIYAGLALAIVLFQGLGLLMYLVNVWPSVRETLPRATVLLISSAVVLGFTRSILWIGIYWRGGRALAVVRTDGDNPDLGERLSPILSTLTRFLVASCILDICFLPAYFLSDHVLPFSVSGWRLGVVEVARIIFPQAFGFAALILAFLTHQYGQMLKERGHMQQELDLTI